LERETKKKSMSHDSPLFDSVIPKDGKRFRVSLDEHFYFHTNIKESIETPSPLVSAAPMPRETLRKCQPEDEFIVSVLVTLAKDPPSRNTPVVAEKDSQQLVSEKQKPLEVYQGYPNSVRNFYPDHEYLLDGDVNSSGTEEENGTVESGASSSEEFLETSEIRRQTVRKSSSLSPQSNFLHQLPRRNNRKSDSDGYSSGSNGRRKRSLEDFSSTKDFQPKPQHFKKRKVIRGIEATVNGMKRGGDFTTSDGKAKRPRWPRFACDKHRKEHAKCPDNCPLRPKKINDLSFC
jgi:hypothetical protein